MTSDTNDQQRRDTSRVWLNPPTDTRPPRRVLIEFTTEQAHLVAALLRAAAHAGGTARPLAGLAYTVEMATQTPAQADAAGVSRLDTEHPANQLSRLMDTALTEFARWSGPVGLAVNALDHAAAIAAHRDGPSGVRELLRYATAKLDTVEHTGYGPVPPASHTDQAGE